MREMYLIRKSANRMILTRSIVLFLVFYGLAAIELPVVLHAEENSCVECHTSTRELLKILRQIEATEPKVTKSAGEG